MDALHLIEGPLPRYDELEYRPPPAVERNRAQRALGKGGGALAEHAIGQDLPHDRCHRHPAAVVAEGGVDAGSQLVQMREMVERDRDLAAPDEPPVAGAEPRIELDRARDDARVVG